jgi:RNA polymerase sigma-70 factor (ECF subfamily)
MATTTGTGAEAALARPSGRDGTHAFLAAAHAAFDPNLRRFFARRGVPRDDLDDMVQEVYLRLARQPGLQDVRSAEAFVIAIAGNLLRDDYRRRGRRGPTVSLDAARLESLPDGHDPQRSVECSQHIAAAGSVLGALRPATRRVFLGHRLAGHSYAELSRELGVSVSMIEKHMIAALSALRPLMAQCGAGS